MESATDQSSDSHLFTMTSVTTPSLCTNIQQSSSDIPATRSDDDPKGAFLFCVAVVCIYGLSIVAFIGSHVKKRQVNKDEERQISRYLKNGHHPVTMNGNRFRVLRFKTSALMCSTLGLRRHMRPISHAESKSSRRARSSFENSDHKNNAEKVDGAEDDNECFLPQREKPHPSHPTEALQQVASIPLKLHMPGQDPLNASLGGTQGETANASSNGTDPLLATAGRDDAEVASSGVKDDETMLTFLDELSSKQENRIELPSSSHSTAKSRPVNCLSRDASNDSVGTIGIHVNGVTVTPSNSPGESVVVWQAAVSVQKPRPSAKELRVMDPEAGAIRPFRGRRSALFPI